MQYVNMNYIMDISQSHTKWSVLDSCDLIIFGCQYCSTNTWASVYYPSARAVTLNDLYTFSGTNHVKTH